MTETELRIRVAPSIAELPAAAWNACAANSGAVQLNHYLKLN